MLRLSKYLITWCERQSKSWNFQTLTPFCFMMVLRHRPKQFLLGSFFNSNYCLQYKIKPPKSCLSEHLTFLVSLSKNPYHSLFVLYKSVVLMHPTLFQKSSHQPNEGLGKNFAEFDSACQGPLSFHVLSGWEFEIWFPTTKNDPEIKE
jgi:hypothetical protein